MKTLSRNQKITMTLKSLLIAGATTIVLSTITTSASANDCLNHSHIEWGSGVKDEATLLARMNWLQKVKSHDGASYAIGVNAVNKNFSYYHYDPSIHFWKVSFSATPCAVSSNSNLTAPPAIKYKRHQSGSPLRRK